MKKGMKNGRKEEKCIRRGRQEKRGKVIKKKKRKRKENKKGNVQRIREMKDENYCSQRDWRYRKEENWKRK